MFRLSDDARVAAISMGRVDYMTLGEACARWKDARHFAIEGALLERGEWRSGMLTVRLVQFRAGPWRVTYDPPPIPVRDLDWHFLHDDYDADWQGEEDGYVGNGLCGEAATPKACLAEIAEIEAEHPHFQKEAA